MREGAALNGDDSGQLVEPGRASWSGVSTDTKAWHVDDLRSGETVFRCGTGKEMIQAPTDYAPWRAGSYVRVIGVCMNEVDPRTGAGLDQRAEDRVVSVDAALRKRTWYGAEDAVVVDAGAHLVGALGGGGASD